MVKQRVEELFGEDWPPPDEPTRGDGAGWLRSPRSLDHLVPASMVQRVGSWVFDAFLICVTVGVPALLVGWWFGPDSMRSCRFVDGSEVCTVLDAEALRFSRITFWVFAGIYLLVFARATTRGRSVGKRSTESEVVDAHTGDHIGWPRAVLRTALAAIGTACFGVTLLFAFTNREHRTLHDVIVGTRVISP